jgi:hypothetical protein
LSRKNGLPVAAKPYHNISQKQPALELLLYAIEYAQNMVSLNTWPIFYFNPDT